MVVNDIDGDGFDVAAYGFGVMDGKLVKKAAFIHAKFEVGLLYEVFDQAVGKVSPLMGGADDGQADWAVKAGDKLSPCVCVARVCASAA